MAFTDEILASARKIALDVVRKYSPTFQWAVVTSTDPLRITYDGRTDPLAVSPSTLVGGLAVGDRVYVVTYMRRAVIVGKAGGEAITQLGPRLKTISPVAGTATVDTGQFLIQGGTFVGKSSAGSGTFGIDFPTPFPTAQVACIAMSGDPNNTGCFYFTIDHDTEQTNAKAFFFGCRKDGTILKDTLLRCNWIAIGY